MESSKQNLAPNPRDSANFLSILTFWWTLDIFRKGYNKVLDITDIFGPTKIDSSKLLVNRLERQWNKQLKTTKPSLLKATFLAFKWECIAVGLLNLIPQLLKSVMYPLLIGRLLRFFRKHPDASYDETIYVTSILIAVILIVTIFGNKMYVDGFHFGMKMRVSVCSLIYRKSLKLSRSALGDTAPGKIVNLLSNDVSRFDISSIFLHTVWVGPFIALFILYFLWIEARWAGMIGSLFVLIVVPVQSYTGKLSSKYRLDIAMRTDERVRFMDEIISGAQVIKMYAWEKPFSKLIQIARKLELNVVRKNGYLRGIYMTFIIFTNRMAMFATMVTLVLMDEQLTAAKVFSILAFYNALSKQLAHLFVRAFAEVVEVLVVFKRLQKFLLYSEKQINLPITEHMNGFHELSEKEKLIESNTQLPNDVAISIRDGTARWNIEESKSKLNETKHLESIALYNINVDFKKTLLIGVIGPIGSGKSSLLQTILGELTFENGSILIDGTLSYASQEPWMFASSVKQNILFGQEMNQSRYDKVVKACALLTDFEQFPHGDNSLVGDRGASLSGGQKARINLARSIYREADIYLLDDPLSAVDAHVGHHLFESVIGPKGFLSKTQSTRILVTHQVHFLKKADWIIVLKDGKVEFQGTPTDLTHSDNSAANLFTIDNNEEGRNRLNSKMSNRSSRGSLNSEFEKIEIKDDNNTTTEDSKILGNVEESSQGKVKGSIIFQYLKTAASPFRICLLISLFLTTQIAGCSADWWVSFWTSQEELRLYYNQTHLTDNSNDDVLSSNTCMYIYAIFIVGLLVIGITRSFEHFNCSMAASQNLHDAMFKGIVSSPMRFFDINPAGRILNRFSKDIGAIDELLPKTMLDSVQLFFQLTGLFVVIAVVNPILLMPLGILGIGFLFVRKVFLKTSNNIKRIEAITRSPVYSHLVSTLNGLSTIRAFGAQDILKQEFDSHQDLHSGAWFMYITTTSAFGFALELICLIFIAVILISFLLFDTEILGDKVGLIITQSLIIPETMQWCARQSAEVSNYMMSVERLLEYRELPSETQPEVEAQLSSQWPSHGKLEFRNVTYRYFNEAEAVLNNINFVISPGEKIGIVGRTGAGKSSLIGAIFRIAVVEGEILIDDVDTNTILLQKLRSKISIIPQDPVLFSGSLRRNLDPFDEFDDVQLWKVLEEIELKHLVTHGGLESSVLAGGSNFSVGQRQLLCLARAILRNNTILVLDEATANVDPDTDTLIQRTIREKFANCTVLTIAHRLHTIMDSDRILVMNLGMVAEFANPYELLQKNNGILREMVEATGLQESERLKNISYDKFKEKWFLEFAQTIFIDGHLLRCNNSFRTLKSFDM